MYLSTGRTAINSAINSAIDLSNLLLSAQNHWMVDSMLGKNSCFKQKDNSLEGLEMHCSTHPNKCC